MDTAADGGRRHYVKPGKAFPQLLELSVCEFDRTAQRDLSYFGTFVGAVKDSSEYKKYVREVIRIAPSGRHFAHHAPTCFHSGDLYAAARNATIYSDGIVCKRSDGSATVSLNMTLKDVYDFHLWGFNEFKNNSVEIYGGNNLAFLSQCLGAIVPYKWYLKFDSDFAVY